MQKFTLKRVSASLLSCVILAAGAAAFTSGAVAASSGSSDAGVQAAGATADPVQRSVWKRGDRRGDYKRGMHRQRIDAAMILPGYGPIPKDVVESLSLNVKQTELLKDAQAFMEQNHRTKLGQQGKAGASRRSLKLTGPVDPHAAVKAQNERIAAMQEARAQHTQKWLAVWDSLEPGQQQKLSDHVVKQAEMRAEQRDQRRAERQSRQPDQRSK